MSVPTIRDMGRGTAKTERIAVARRSSEPLPTIELAEVIHVGSLDPAAKGLAGPSHEGHGLSISLDPESWQQIARLGGNDWWQLERPGARFLDVHALGKAERERIASWGIEQGLVEQRQMWRVSYFDSEVDDEVGFLCASESEAMDEAAATEDAKVTSELALCPTIALEEAIGQCSAPDCFDHLLVLWVEREHADLDGLWWADEYGLLSAPRGVILPSRLASWTRKRL